jgi:hypothetical protein
MQFKRGIDPKEALGIGLFSYREFDSLTEAKIWLVENHLKILGLNTLCFPCPTPEQYDKLRQYADKYMYSKRIENTIWGWSDFLVNGVDELYRELNACTEEKFKHFANSDIIDMWTINKKL